MNFEIKIDKIEDYNINDVSSTEYCENQLAEQKSCSVCGDKALGFNFGAITCESCKAFFRRNAFKNILPCDFEHNCEITVNTRRFCSFCRLKKCFNMKMKTEKILINSKSRRPTKTSPTRSTKSHNTRSSNFTQDSIPNNNHHSIIPSTSSSDRPTQIMSVTKYSRLMSVNDKLTREGKARLLTEDEWLVLTGLCDAYTKHFIYSGSMPTDQMEKANLSSLVNSSGFIVRRFINFAKKIKEFTSLEQPCQIVLLKGSVLNSIILRSVIEFDVDKNAWVTPKGEISAEIIRAAGLYQLHEDYATYSRSFKSLMGSDDYMVCLSQVLCLFASNHQGLTDRQMISDIHDKYLVLLKHYLEAKYGFMESKSVFISILSNMKDLELLTSKHGQILLHIDPTDVDPLMLEVFNMSINHYFKN